MDKGKEKVIEFLNGLEELNQENNDVRLDKFIKDTFEFIENNEHRIGLENLFENLYEFEIHINQNLLEIAKVAIQKMKMNWEQYQFIQELVKPSS